MVGLFKHLSRKQGKMSCIQYSYDARMCGNESVINSFELHGFC